MANCVKDKIEEDLEEKIDKRDSLNDFFSGIRCLDPWFFTLTKHYPSILHKLLYEATRDSTTDQFTVSINSQIWPYGITLESALAKFKCLKCHSEKCSFCKNERNDRLAHALHNRRNVSIFLKTKVVGKSDSTDFKTGKTLYFFLFSTCPYNYFGYGSNETILNLVYSCEGDEFKLVKREHSNNSIKTNGINFNFGQNIMGFSNIEDTFLWEFSKECCLEIKIEEIQVFEEKELKFSDTDTMAATDTMYEVDYDVPLFTFVHNAGTDTMADTDTIHIDYDVQPDLSKYPEPIRKAFTSVDN